MPFVPTPRERRRLKIESAFGNQVFETTRGDRSAGAEEIDDGRFEVPPIGEQTLDPGLREIRQEMRAANCEHHHQHVESPTVQQRLDPDAFQDGDTLSRDRHETRERILGGNVRIIDAPKPRSVIVGYKTILDEQPMAFLDGPKIPGIGRAVLARGDPAIGIGSKVFDVGFRQRC